MARPGLSLFATIEVADFNEQIANDATMLDTFERVVAPQFPDEELVCLIKGYCKFLSESRRVQFSESLIRPTLTMTSTFPNTEAELLRRV
ncbi:MAG: hypothetical protein ACOVRM_01000, partial [Planctomycetaceae bacterium]